MVTFLLKSTKLLLDDQESSNMNTINNKLKEKEMNMFVHMVQLDMLNADSEKKVCNGNSENTLVSEYWSVNWNFTIRYLQKKIVTDFFRY